MTKVANVMLTGQQSVYIEPCNSHQKSKHTPLTNAKSEYAVNRQTDQTPSSYAYDDGRYPRQRHPPWIQIADVEKALQNLVSSHPAYHLDYLLQMLLSRQCYWRWVVDCWGWRSESIEAWSIAHEWQLETDPS